MHTKIVQKLLSSLLLILLLFTTGCSPTQDKSAELKSVTDSKGNRITIVQKPKRIVSMTIGTDEIVMDLVAPERIAALSSLADDPGISYIADRSAQVPNKINSYSAESIIALKPDLVLIADWWQLNILTTLRKAGLNVYVYKTPYTMEDIKSTIAEIANVVGEQAAGEKTIAAYDKQLSEIQTKLQTIPASERKSVLVMSGKSGFGGKGSLYDDLCKKANIKNALADIPYQQAYTLSKESLVELNPEVIITCTWSAKGMTENKSRSDILCDPAFQTVQAVQNKQVVELGGRVIYSNSHYVVYSMQNIAAAIYPKYFTK